MAYSVKERVFGADIPPEIKQKLALRQELNRSADFGEAMTNVANKYGEPSIYPRDFPEGKGVPEKVLADLSSRTPFARMWVAIQAWVGEPPKPKDSKDYGPPPKKPPTLEQQQADWKKGVVYEWSKDGTKIMYRKYTQKPAIQVYEVGNHILNTLSKEPHKPVNTIDALLPDEHNVDFNAFMKPQAGITSISSETEGPLGMIKKTTVNFIVHNFADYETIFSRYFLRHGAQIFVDFGWSTLYKDLYDPRELIDNGILENIEDKLYGENGVVTLEYGDLETNIGLVTSYDAKITSNGSVECSIELTSKNAALVQNNVSTAMKNRIKHSLDIEVLRFASAAYKDSPIYTESTNPYATAESAREWEEIFYAWGEDFLSTEENIPTYTKDGTENDALEVGVFIGKNKKEGGRRLFVSWGFFEDKILNIEFGFGENAKDISSHAKNLESRFNSTFSFIRWDKRLYESQKQNVDIQTQDWLYPNWWHGSKPFTYNTKRQSESLQDEIDRLLYKMPEGIKNKGWYDQTLNRMPLRELFISVDLIKEAINSATDIMKMIKHITDKLNQSTEGIFDLQMTSNKYSHAEISFVDRNLSATDEKQTWFDTLFTFTPGSPSTIVKDYDISFTIPTGNLQNVVAIQSMPAGGKMFPVDIDMDRLLGTEAAERPSTEKDSITAMYLPTIGAYRGQRLNQDEQESAGLALNFAGQDTIFMDRNINDDKLLNGYNILTSGLHKGKVISQVYNDKAIAATLVANQEKTEKVLKEDNKKQAEMDAAEGKVVAANLSDFYLKLAKFDIFINQISPILYATLTLKIYGISALVPGDVFKVDFIPKKYKDQVFFQVMKVSHDISTSTWETTIETQMRLFRGVKERMAKEKQLWYKPTKVILSKDIIDDLGLSFHYRRYQMKNNPMTYSREELKSAMKDVEGIADLPKKGYISSAYNFLGKANTTIFIPGMTDVKPYLLKQCWVSYGYIYNKNGKSGFLDNIFIVEDAPYKLIVSDVNISGTGKAWIVVPGEDKLETYKFDPRTDCAPTQHLSK